MKIKSFFSHRITSLLLVFLLAFTMLPTGALAVEVPDESHAHTEECNHEETVETLVTDEEESAASETAADTYEIASDTEVTEVTEETTEVVTETETVEEATSGNIKGSSVEWSYDSSTGRLTISGSGDCPEFTSAEDQPWISYRDQIIEVWFYDMDALSISNIAYWFDGCSALTMAEIPYTTPVVGTRAFADCPNLKTVLVYHDGGFSISAGAFSVDDLTILEVRYIPSSEASANILTSYDWIADNRAVYFEDAYGISLLATGYCIYCNTTCSYTVDYQYWTETTHSIRHWCSNCGDDQCGGTNAGSHTYNNSGSCTLCGYYNSAYDNSVCYHTSTYTSWSGCDWYKYCRSCGGLVDYGTSHGSSRREWSGCNWYDYCSNCGQLMDSGVSHNYSYGSWEYYNTTRHKRTGTCTSCGATNTDYGNHSKKNTAVPYNSTQHKYGSYCATCQSFIGSVSYRDHNFTYGNWQNYSGTQHRRLRTCSACGYSDYEYVNHSLSYSDWISYSSTQHKRIVSCSCGYSTTEYVSHTLTYGDWTTCEDENYSSKHQRTVSCLCGYSGTEYGDHFDENDDGYCDDCSYLMTRFSVTVPANLSLTVSKNGEVYSATSADILNNSTGTVAVTSIVVSAENGWTLVPYSTNMANEKVDTKQIGFSINGAETVNSGSTETLSLADNWAIAKSDSLALSYDAVASAMSEPVSEQVLTIVFVVDWAA